MRGNQAAYASHKDVSRQTVTDWKQTGLLVFDENGDVDFAATDKRLVDHGIRQPADTNLTDSAYIDAEEVPWSRAEAERVKENYSALLKQLEFERESEKVVEIDDAATHIREEYSLVRNRLRRISGDIAPRIASVASAEEIKALVDAAVIRALEDLSLPEPV